MKWFKFYGQDWMTDPKMMSLRIEDRLVFLTLLCLAGNENTPGKIFGCDEETAISLTHLSQDIYNPDFCPTERAKGVFKRLEEKGMITNDNNGTLSYITVSNFCKRQEQNLTGYERVKRYRENIKKTQNKPNNKPNKSVINDNAMITLDKIRIDKNRIDSKSATADALTYEDPLKETFNNKKKTYEKLGIPYVPKKRTNNQKLAWDTELASRFLEDKAMELHRVKVYINKKESAKGWQAIKRAVKEFDLEETKKIMEHYLNSDKFDKFGADPAVVLSDHSINAYLTKTNKSKTGGILR